MSCTAWKYTSREPSKSFAFSNEVISCMLKLLDAAVQALEAKLNGSAQIAGAATWRTSALKSQPAAQGRKSSPKKEDEALPKKVEYGLSIIRLNQLLVCSFSFFCQLVQWL